MRSTDTTLSSRATDSCSGQDPDDTSFALDAVVQSAPGLYLLRDHRGGRVRFLNGQAGPLLGRPMDGWAPFELLRGWVAPDDRPRLDSLEAGLDVVEVGETLETELRLVHADGRPRHFLGRHTLLRRDERGRALQSLVLLLDVTERRQLYDALERKGHELQSILNATPEAFFRLDASGAVTHCLVGSLSPAGLVPKGTANAPGRPLSEVMDPDAFARLSGLLRRAAHSRATVSEDFVFHDRPEASFEARVVPLLRGETMVVLRDLSDRARVERDMREQEAKSIQAAKMASLGQMAAGMAHEINSPLAIISMHAELVLEHANDDGEVDRALLAEDGEVLRTTARRIAQIVKSLKTFARDEQAAPMVPVSVRALLADTRSLCSARFRQGDVALQIADVAEELSVTTRQSEATQILINLLANAYDAVEPLEPRWVRVDVTASESQVVLSVTDSGPGIPPAIVPRLFSLFFTTKDVGKGTGLGLGISRRLAEALGGSLELDEDSPNTRFVLRLPRHRAG